MHKKKGKDSKETSQEAQEASQKRGRKHVNTNHFILIKIHNMIYIPNELEVIQY